jgi:hypothetical protein
MYYNTVRLTIKQILNKLNVIRISVKNKNEVKSCQKYLNSNMWSVSHENVISR